MGNSGGIVTVVSSEPLRSQGTHGRLFKEEKRKIISSHKIVYI
jgi:hypothetical protein